MMWSTVCTSGGLELVIRPARAEDHGELHAAFAAIVSAGEGYPHEPGPLPYAEFATYWLENKSLVVVGRVGNSWRVRITLTRISSGERRTSAMGAISSYQGR